MAPLEARLTAPNGVTVVLPTGLFINNEFVAASAGGKITSISPINGEEICSVEAASAADVDRAVAAARAAFDDDEGAWRSMTGAERGALMLRLADLAEEQRELLATVETWDNGKPYGVALNEDVAEVLACLRYYAGWADKLHGQTIPTGRAKLAYTLRQPVGVCAQIIPWNYPLAMAAWKLGPALAAGNVVVLKPAEQTPLSILLLADLVRRAGFPPGVINVVNGLGPEAGRALTEHADVDKIAFTGSTLTGRQVMRAAAAGLKNVTLETGGKSPLLVFADADMEQAARWAYVGIMSNQGQVCTATSRLLVEASVADRFAAAFLDVVRARARVGDPFADETTHGPQVSRAQYERVLRYVDGARAQGARLELGGGPAADGIANGHGFFVQPTVFSAVTPDMDVFRDEVFGPLVTITPFTGEAEALRLANDSIYGLAAAVFSQNIERAHRVAAALHAGMVWINSSNDSEIQVPFGGVKQSGIGRELGEAALAAYTEIKSVHVNLGTRL
ncbi:hypothetical protein CDD83_869 [Cordyceps sp. RAO-2017]|nr:hypothetical protein CDD83_869 [Cordyceps sp. RAO-2017]